MPSVLPTRTLAIDVTRQTFQEVVIEGSRHQPVLVDFWAPWCGPCRALGPILEKLAAEYGGRFVLAKINSDEEPELSAQFGVRGIPDVKVFADGQVVDEFSGALPESAVRRFLDPLIPSMAEPVRLEAAALRAAGDPEGALARLEAALDIDPRAEPVTLDHIEVLLELGRLDDARPLLAAIDDGARDAKRVAQLRARLDLGRGGVDTAALERRLAADPGDLSARLELANALAAVNEHPRALAHALDVVQRDRNFADDGGRRTMLRIFDLLGPDSDLVRQYRRELAAVINR